MDHPLLIFDCDGVLIDSEAIYIEIELEHLSARGIAVERDWYMRNFMALDERRWRQRYSELIAARTGAPMSEDEYADFKRMVRARVLEEVRPIDGIEALLERLKAPRCVASSTIMAFLPRKLEKTGLARFFGEAVFSGEMVENGKPAPDLFIHAARQMGRDPSHCVTVEDSVNGVIGAKAAGTVVIGFTGGGHWIDRSGTALIEAGADHVVTSHGELADWLAENTGAL